MIKKILQSNNLKAMLIANIMYMVLFFLTFDSYSLQLITPETPFMKIGDLPFYRMEFILILGSVFALIGMGIGILLKKMSSKFLPISTALVGAIAFIVAFLDVDTMQSLLPTMRISHVIMTVSRMLGILVAVSGLFIGLNISSILKLDINIDKESMFMGVIIAILLSWISILSNNYYIGYLLVGIFLILNAILGEQNNNCSVVDAKVKKLSILSMANKFFNIGALVFLIGTMNSFTINTLQTNYITYAIILGISIISFVFGSTIMVKNISYFMTLVAVVVCLVLSSYNNVYMVMLGYPLITFIIGMNSSKVKGNNLSMIINYVAVLVFAVIAYIFVHNFSQVTTHSGNRVIHAVNSSLFIIVQCFIVIAQLCLVPYKIVFTKNQKAIKAKEDNEKAIKEKEDKEFANKDNVNETATA